MSEKRPPCVTCGRELRISKFSRKSVHWGSLPTYDFKTREGARAYIPEGARVTRIVGRYDEATGYIAYIEPNPKFGDYGDGFFCGLRCGYRFAVAVMKRTVSKIER